MDQGDYRAQGGEKKGGGGSVRRARERMNAQFEFGVPMNGPNMQPSMQRPDNIPRYPPANRRQAPMPAALSSKNNQPIGASISRPTPVAQNIQWPLPEGGDANRNMDSSMSPPRGPPPKRPPRPKNVPSLLDSSKIQDYTPSFPNRQPRPQQLSPQQDQHLSPFSDPSDSPATPNSADLYSTERSSTTSSTGTIPDFPIPSMPLSVPAAVTGPPRRTINPGPPPTMRRGVSSYYSQTSFVSPIPEEMPESLRGGGSIASSRAIPSSWGSRPDGFDVEMYADNIEEEEDEMLERAESSQSQNSEAGLVRQASIGKKAKPTLRTINSSDDAVSKRQENIPDMPNTSMSGGLQPSGNRTIPLESSSGSSLPSSQETLPRFPNGPSPVPMSRSPLNSPTDPDVGNFGSLNSSRTSIGMVGMSDRVPESRRPPRLNMDAVKEAEARGSLTSLPDLIRRATRLAANLDRGRTASRLGLFEIMNAESNNETRGAYLDKDGDLEKRKSGSISSILASFPPPGLATPIERGQRPISQWPTTYDDAGQATIQGGQGKKKGRRCCGMPRGVFFLVLFVLLLLIAAAVVIPIVLIVLPKMKHTSTGTAAPDTTASGCQKTNPCLNGGVSVTTNNQCRCVCVNGFTGSTCNTAGDASCTTTQDSAASNATIGNAIPRLISTSSTNFSIPLDEQGILSLFSSNNLSCTSENALVTFNGKSSKRFYILPTDLQPGSILTSEDNVVIEKRHIIDEVLVARQVASAIATTNGIVYFPTSTIASYSGYTSGTSVMSAASQTGQTTATTASSAATSTATSGAAAAGLTLTSDVLDFARLIVLFVLNQTNQLSSAVTAQEKIQEFFGGSMTTSSMSMGMTMGTSTNFTLNFSNFSITLQNGTTIGGRGNGNGGLKSS